MIRFVYTAFWRRREQEAIFRQAVAQAMRLWTLRNVCPECGFLFEDGHGAGCVLTGIEAAELPEMSKSSS